MVRHRLIVRDFARDKIFAYSLPIEAITAFFGVQGAVPAEVSLVNRVAWGRWGIKCIVHRACNRSAFAHVRDGIAGFELPFEPPMDERWVDACEVKERELISRCIAERRVAEWERPGGGLKHSPGSRLSFHRSWKDRIHSAAWEPYHFSATPPFGSFRC
jgi:hypothetical protein